MEFSDLSSPPKQTLLDYIKVNQSVIAADPWLWWGPMVEWLAALHVQGRSNGALVHGTIHVLESGGFDLGYLDGIEGRPSAKDSAYPSYYPYAKDGSKPTQQQDLHALAVAFYFSITGACPSVISNGPVSLAAHEEVWPAEFLRLTERLLAWPEDVLSAEELWEQHWAAFMPKPPEPPPMMSLPAADEPTESPVEEPSTPSDPEPDPAQEPEPPDLNVQMHPRLPNTTAGRQIRHEISTLLSAGAEFIAQIQPLTKLPPGMQCDGTAFFGQPTTPGDYSIAFECIPKDAFKHPSLEILCTTWLTVNPDPRSLWKDLPPDFSKPYAKDSTAYHSITDSPLPLLAASRRGRSHAHEGTFRDDDFAIDWFPLHGWYLLCVADGAGSAKFSRQGSKIACETIHKSLTATLASEKAPDILAAVENWVNAESEDTLRIVRNEFYEVLGRAALKARKAIEEEVAKAQAQLKDFNTTLIAVLARPCGDSWFFASFSIGDGAAGLAGGPAGGARLLTSPDGGEFAGQTLFLTMKEAMADGKAILSRIQLNKVPDFSALLVMTDGVSDPKFASDMALRDPQPWDALWTEVSEAIAAAGADREQQAKALLEWLNFWSTGNHDDRTIAVLFPPTPSPELSS